MFAQSEGSLASVYGPDFDRSVPATGGNVSSPSGLMARLMTTGPRAGIVTTSLPLTRSQNFQLIRGEAHRFRCAIQPAVYVNDACTCRYEPFVIPAENQAGANGLERQSEYFFVGGTSQTLTELLAVAMR